MTDFLVFSSCGWRLHLFAFRPTWSDAIKSPASSLTHFFFLSQVKPRKSYNEKTRARQDETELM